ncbi:MAG: DUF2344 domain-containing protein [Chloroflexi bacterium]|nr:DUF2344 domain-containing protein [Chloroflexota bacterium]
MNRILQRLRVTFSRGEEVKYIAHLDIMRLWERVLRRAQISLAYSQGFTPHPKVSIAAPLAVGVTSEAELMDVFLTRRMSPYYFTKAVSPQLPPGIGVLAVQEVGLKVPSLQSMVRFAEYNVLVSTDGKGLPDLQPLISSLLESQELPWSHSRDKSLRSYDLRALIDDIWLIGWHDTSGTLGMRLRTDSAATGRPEQVALALGFTDHPQAIHRTKLILGR